jgi:hypothetical protein
LWLCARAYTCPARAHFAVAMSKGKPDRDAAASAVPA